MSIRIVLADDHRIVREGLRALVEKEQGIDVIGEAEDGRTAVRLALELFPDVVIMDITMPDLNGIEATRQILDKAPNIKVVALSIHRDKRFVTGMFKAGASGYLLKDSAFEELSKAIYTVVANQKYLSPSAVDLVVRDYLHSTATEVSQDSYGLTSREREVLQLLVEGKSTKEIALILKVSVKTAETHRYQIMQKLGIHNIAELTKFAIREGMTSL